MSRAFLALAALSVALTSACKRETTQATPSASAAAAPAPAPRASRPRGTSSLPAQPPPPLAAGASAKPLGAGGSWELLQPGKRDAGPPPHRMVAEVGVWRSDGTPLYATPPGGSITLDTTAMPATLQQAVAEVGAGGSARFWLPPELVDRWRPSDLLTGSLVLDVKIVSLEPAPQGTVTFSPRPSDGTPPPPYPFPLEAGGPRPDAAATPSGLRHVRLKAGSGPKLPPGKLATVRYSAFSSVGLQVTPIERDRSVALMAAQSPGGLGEVLQDMTVGETRRVWVSGPAAASIVPGFTSGQLMIDLTLEGLAK